MTRLLKLAVVILSVISLASAQFVDTLNTPLGPVTQGAKVSVSWTLLPGADATTATGDLSASDSATKNVISIDPKVPLGPKSYLWEVKVPPGTYTLGLNDGSGLKQSGEVVVNAPAGGAAPPAGGDAPAASPPPAAQVSGSGESSTGKGADAPSGTSPTSPDAASSPTPTGSASSIFSGYDIVFSLLGVAIAMVQF